MTFSAGTKLGPYEILSLIGEGGMGQVYKARDARLNRTVAIKVLPQHISSKPDLKVRFEREAQTLASLSHPHICPVFDVGQQGDADYLVMEYLEGQTLAERLEKGALPVDEALKAAMEIADALDKAHRQGIVHRDLKPGNIMLTKSGAKLLDFGLAKLKQEAGSVSGLSGLATNPSMTAEGAILGTLQYMAPEQLEGKEADSRTDIFAFGATLYEAITGKKAFEGKSQASLIGSILKDTPRAISALQPVAPATLDRLIMRCLAKDPDDRWQTARDLLLELKWIAEGHGSNAVSAQGQSQWRQRDKFRSIWAATATLLLAVAAGVLGFQYLREPGALDEIRFQLPTPNQQNVRIYISPNGRWIVFQGITSSNKLALFVREIRSVTSRQLPGTEGGSGAFWPPDSRYIGFIADGKMKKMDASGGSPQTICCERGGVISPTWNNEGVIVFNAGGILYRVSAAGGQATPITALDESHQEIAHRWPRFLPDGRHFLYSVTSREESNNAVYIGSLGSNERTRLMAGNSTVIYAEPGYLLYQRAGTLFAQPFDAKKLIVTGEPVQIADKIPYGATGQGSFDASQTGVLIFREGAAAATHQLVWLDRTGKNLKIAGEPASYGTFNLSPDGKQIAFDRTDLGNEDLWLMEWERGVSTRFTFNPTSDFGPVWSPDGLRIAFNSNRTGSESIFEKKSSGTADETLLLDLPNNEHVKDWSSDGRYIAFTSNTDLHVLPLFGDRKPLRIVQSPSQQDEPRFSPDGKWLAYNSNESGTWQVYVVSFPGADQKRQISVNGGVQPRWRRDVKELYYLDLDGKMIAVDITTGSRIEPGIPRVLFDTNSAPTPNNAEYAVTPDGQRFLVRQPVAETAPTPITVVVNWTASLKK